MGEEVGVDGGVYGVEDGDVEGGGFVGFVVRDNIVGGVV